MALSPGQIVSLASYVRYYATSDISMDEIIARWEEENPDIASEPDRKDRHDLHTLRLETIRGG